MSWPVWELYEPHLEMARRHVAGQEWLIAVYGNDQPAQVAMPGNRSRGEDAHPNGSVAFSEERPAPVPMIRCPASGGGLAENLRSGWGVEAWEPARCPPESKVDSWCVSSGCWSPES